MQFPLEIRFKIVALASQIQAKDSSGNELFYVKQKLFRLKENIEVYRNSSQSELLFNIKADKVIDFSPVFSMTGPDGQVIGSIKRHGARSIWKANYSIELEGQPVATVNEVNPWIKFFDGLLAQVPLLGIFSGYFLQPKYSVSSPDGHELARLDKKPAFLEGRFALVDKQLSTQDEATQYRMAVLLMVLVLLERTRG